MKKLGFIVGANALTFLGQLFLLLAPLLKREERATIANWLESQYLALTEWYTEEE